MRQTWDELVREGWEVKEAPFQTAVKSDGTIAMRCMACGHPYKGGLIATGGVVLCNRCLHTPGTRLVNQAIGRGVMQVVVSLLKRFR